MERKNTGPMSVSYTHLDVYKRQNDNSIFYFYLVVMISGIVLIIKGLRNQYVENKKKAAADAAESDKDVYKRQTADSELNAAAAS